MSPTDITNLKVEALYTYILLLILHMDDYESDVSMINRESICSGGFFYDFREDDVQ